MVQDWVTGNKHQARTEISEEPKVFYAGRNNSVKKWALCSLCLPAFLCPKAGSNKLNKSNIVHTFPFAEFTS